MSKFTGQANDIAELFRAQAKQMLDMPGSPSSKIQAALYGFMMGLTDRLPVPEAVQYVDEWLEKDYNSRAKYYRPSQHTNHNHKNFSEEFPDQFDVDRGATNQSATEAEYKRQSAHNTLWRMSRQLEYEQAEAILGDELAWRMLKTAYPNVDLSFIKRKSNTSYSYTYTRPNPGPSQKTWWGYELGFVEIKTYTRDEIKSAYRRKVQIYHPDKGGNPEAFQKIQTAYETGMHSIGETP